jgi:hypothetical protein
VAPCTYDDAACAPPSPGTPRLGFKISLIRWMDVEAILPSVPTSATQNRTFRPAVVASRSNATVTSSSTGPSPNRNANPSAANLALSNSARRSLQTFRDSFKAAIGLYSFKLSFGSSSCYLANVSKRAECLPRA